MHAYRSVLKSLVPPKRLVAAPTKRWGQTASAALLAGFFLLGCASSEFRQVKASSLAEADSSPQNRPQPLLDQGYEETKESEIDDPSGTLTLNQAIALSMQRNPELQAFVWDAQGAQALIRQARLWPNPELEFERENFAGTGQFSGSDSAETTISLAQSLPFGGEIKRGRELAELQSDLANWDYHAARLAALVEVTQRFVEALAADRRLKLSRQELELAQATERIAVGRVDAGDASPVELARVVVPVMTAELGLAQAERSRKSAYRRLALTWGGRAVTFESVAGNLDSVAPPPAPEELVRLINGSPAIARWTTEISTRIAERRLAQAEAIPDLKARLGFKRDNRSDDDALVVGLSLPLPLFDRNQGDIQAARSRESAAQSRKQAAELRIESLLSAACADLAAAYDEAVALGERALPAANRAYQATQQAFEEGKLPFLDVLDAQRTLFELQTRYLDALIVYHSMTAEIESLVGSRLTEISG